MFTKNDEILAKAMYALGAYKLTKNKKGLVFWNKDCGGSKLPKESFSSLKKNHSVFIDEAVDVEQPSGADMDMLLKTVGENWDKDDAILAYALYLNGVKFVSKNPISHAVRWHTETEHGYLPSIAFAHMNGGSVISLNNLFDEKKEICA